jgi:hypothetical protein
MGAEKPGAANRDLRFVPRVLSDHCQRLIESYHAIHGYACLPDILWRAEVREFVEIHEHLRAIFRKASITRSARKANLSYVQIASALLALEILASDFLGWGGRFPWAKKKAALLLEGHLPPAREYLKDVYLCQRNYVRPQAVSTVIAPPPDVSQSHGIPQ